MPSELFGGAERGGASRDPSPIPPWLVVAVLLFAIGVIVMVCA